MADALTVLLAWGLGIVIGPQVILSLFYGAPRAVVGASNGQWPWSVVVTYLVTPALWGAVLAIGAFVVPGFTRQVVMSAGAFGLVGLLWFRQSARADFEERVRQSLVGPGTDEVGSNGRTVACPACDAAVEIEGEDLEEIEIGDSWSCEACGAVLRVTTLDPLEFDTAD